ncbi:MAG: ACT domain-containing protein, partial [Chloroflexi bacterium]|nr:ACT domain-containing protein [Chloroflexota bacterium]
MQHALTSSQPPPRDRVLTLLISAPDKPGLVAGVAGTLYEHDANILEADQHDDAGTGMFFQRIRFEIAAHGVADLTAAMDALGERLGLDWSMRDRGDLRKVAILVSREDHCLYDLLVRHRSGELPCDIRAIISNHETLAPVAAQFGVAFHLVPVTAGTVARAEETLQRLLVAASVDLIVLARYMR